MMEYGLILNAPTNFDIDRCKLGIIFRVELDTAIKFNIGTDILVLHHNSSSRYIGRCEEITFAVGSPYALMSVNIIGVDNP